MFVCFGSMPFSCLHYRIYCMVIPVSVHKLHDWGFALDLLLKMTTSFYFFVCVCIKTDTCYFCMTIYVFAICFPNSGDFLCNFARQNGSCKHSIPCILIPLLLSGLAAVCCPDLSISTCSLFILTFVIPPHDFIAFVSLHLCLWIWFLPAPRRDQRLQFRVYATLQLDPGHHGPQQHCVQPHSLWVRASVLSHLISQDMLISTNALRDTYSACASIHLLHKTAVQ